MDLADRILTIRNNLGLTQEKFGEKVGKSQRTVAAWESGTRAPSFSTLCLLADTFNISVDYLLGRTESPAMFLDTKKDPSPLEQERARVTAAAALSDVPTDQQAMPKDVQELTQLIQRIVDHTLGERGTPKDDQ